MRRRKNRRSSSKRKAQIRHCAKRSSERLGYSISKQKQSELISKIQNNQAEFVRKQSNRVTIWIVDGLTLVYDKMRKTIVTVLPD